MRTSPTQLFLITTTVDTEQSIDRAEFPETSSQWNETNPSPRWSTRDRPDDEGDAHKYANYAIKFADIGSHDELLD